MQLPHCPTFSVIINTNGRKDALAKTIASLRFLDYPTFEVCVVYGPSPDGTREMLEALSDEIKIAFCPEFNLSMSRNIGIGIAAGEIVAFVDDDAMPEPEWLRDIVAGYDAEGVGGAGGLVYDHTGWNYQYRYATANRLGNSDWHRTTPAMEFNFPLSDNFPYIQGTNATFRRAHLIEVGGFDEEIEFYLDETDVCCRMVDCGYIIRQLPNAAVHHKCLPSRIRNADRVTRVRYPVIKNKIYFSLVNNHGHYTMREVIEDARKFIEGHAADAEAHAAAGRLSRAEVEQFWKDVDRAWERGLRVGLGRQRRLLAAERAEALQQPYREFPRRVPAGGRKVFCFLSQEYPPDQIGGIGTYTHSVATALAAVGHHVHVLTRSDEGNIVDFEDDVWVHRLEVKRVPQPNPSPLAFPQRIWNYSATMLEELHKISKKQPIACVEGPIWDGEPIAALLDGRFPTVVSLHTTLATWLESHKQDADYMRDFGLPMIMIEKYLMQHANAVHANSHAIVAEIKRLYEVDLDASRTRVIHHGIPDLTLQAAQPPEREKGVLRLLFIGRLEQRKGIDVLLEAFAELLGRHPKLHLDVVGDDQIPWHESTTFRNALAGWPIAAKVLPHVSFHGKVSDAELRGFLGQSDVLVVPSRFESFGLTALEGFAFGLAVVASQAGGLAEVVTDGETGLAPEPGNAKSLAAALERVVTDQPLRHELARKGRVEYEKRFNSARMAAELGDFMGTLERSYLPADDLHLAKGSVRHISLWEGETGLLLQPDAVVEIAAPAKPAHLTFWTHPWSGIVNVHVGKEAPVELDLFARAPRLQTFTIATCDSAGPLRIVPANRRSGDAQGEEVILYGVSFDCKAGGVTLASAA